jgi:predicted O-methyltransferase YrrM
VYSSSRLAIKYIKYYLAASNGRGHGIHSPFIYHFITKVLNDRRHYPAYDKVEDLRRSLSKVDSLLDITDPGAGSKKNNAGRRSIGSLIGTAAKPKKYAQLLYRIAGHYDTQNILELGTSLGLTTAYLSLAKPEAGITTIEGVPQIAAQAKQNFQSLGLKNITLIEGNFDDILKPTLSKIPSVDLVFFDGNHRREPTERYFNWVLPKVHNDSILIFDDIHWSLEMEQAWDTVRNHDMVRASVDLFSVGVLFFRKEFLDRQHFIIRF